MDFWGPNVLFFFIHIHERKKKFFIISRLKKKSNSVSFVNKGNCIQYAILISALKESFSWWKYKNKVFRQEKTPKSHKNIRMSSKKNLNDLIYQLLILFVSWRCCDPSAQTDIFKKFWFRTVFVVVWYWYWYWYWSLCKVKCVK